jgi:hypothetical protein
MKRLFLFAAVAILASTWSRPAFAQYGMGGFGSLTDPNAEIDQQRSTMKSQMGTYARPQAARGRSGYTRLSNPASMDSYGRMDLAGHPVPGYPAVRGDLRGPNATHVSRGGANGRGARRFGGAGRRQTPPPY